MEKLISVAGNLLAVAGVLMCFGAGLVRLSGEFHLYGYSAVTIFMAGIGLMVMACLAKLEVLLLRGKHRV